MKNLIASNAEAIFFSVEIFCYEIELCLQILINKKLGAHFLVVG
jgi:hypothetical protein